VYTKKEYDEKIKEESTDGSTSTVFVGLQKMN